MCLHFPFTRGSLGSVVQGLVLLGVLVHNWRVQLRQGDVTDNDAHLLPPLMNLSNTLTTTTTV